MNVGFFQILLILLVIILLFGAGKIPRIMKDLAKGIKIFRSEISSNTKKDMDNDSTAPDIPQSKNNNSDK